MSLFNNYNNIYNPLSNTTTAGTGTVDPSEIARIDAELSLKVNRNGDIMTGLLSGLTPVNPSNFATKAYADSLIAGGADFSDAGFNVFNTVDPTKQLALDCSTIDTATTRTYVAPNQDGTLALTSDIPVIPTTFQDDEFAIFNNLDISKVLNMDTSLITTATIRTLQVPDADGIIALTSDLIAPSSNFNDADLNIFNDLDNTKQIAFDCSNIDTLTTRVYIAPNSDGTLALTTDIPTISTTFDDTEFSLFNAGIPTNLAKFNASNLTAPRTYNLPDESATLATLNDITSSFVDSAFQIYDDSDLTKGINFQLSNITTGTTRTYTYPDVNDEITTNTATQTLTNKNINMLGKTITNLADATLPQQPATKNQLDALASGIIPQGSALLLDNNLNSAWTYNNGTSGVGATLTRNIIDNVYSIDGVPLVLNTSVLFVGNFGPLRNGYYICNEPGSISAAAQFTRDPRFDGTTPENQRGSLFSILEGITYSNTLWVQISPNTVAVGIDPINYDNFSNTSVLTSGINTTINSNAIDVDITQDLNMHTINKIINLATPTLDFDASTKKYVDDNQLIAGINTTINTNAIDINITQNLDMHTTNKIINLATPTLDFDASTKKYVDDSINSVGFVDAVNASYAYILLSGSSANNTVHNMTINNSQGTDITLPNATYALLQPGSYQLISRIYSNGSVQMSWIIQTSTVFSGPYNNVGRSAVVRSYSFVETDTPSPVASALITVTVPTYVRSINGGNNTINTITGSFEIVRIDRRIAAQNSVFNDNEFTIRDDLDNTKTVKFQLNGITTGQIRTMTVQNSSGTIAYLSNIPSPYTASGNITLTGQNFDTSAVLNFNVGDTYLRDDTTGFTLRLDSALGGFSSNKSIQFKDEGGTVALLSDITGGTYTASGNITLTGQNFDTSAVLNFNVGDTYLRDDTTGFTLRLDSALGGFSSNKSIQFKDEGGTVALLTDIVGTTYTSSGNIQIIADDISTTEPFNISKTNLRITDGANYSTFDGVFTGIRNAIIPDKSGTIAFLDDVTPAQTPTPYIELGNELLVNGGDATINVWTQRQLNTVYQISNSSATLVSNQLVNLEAGTYDINCVSVFSKTSDTCIRLYNVTNAVQIILGAFTPINSGAGSIANTAHLMGRFTLSTTSTLELQYFASNNPISTVDLGDYSGGLLGVPVVFTKLIIKTSTGSAIAYNPVAEGSFYAKNFTTPKLINQTPLNYHTLNIWSDVSSVPSQWISYHPQNRLLVLSGNYFYNVSFTVFISSSDIALAQNFTCALIGSNNPLAPALWGLGTEASATASANEIVKITGNFSNVQIAGNNYMGLSFKNNNAGDPSQTKVYQVLLTIDRA